MNTDEFKVSDYGIFSDAIGTTSTLTNSLSENQAKVNEIKSQLDDDSIFMGPIADSIILGFADVDTSMTTLTDNFGKISQYINDCAVAYQNGDKTASSVVLGIGATATEYRQTGTKELTGSNLDFVNSIKDGAVESYNKYGVLPSLTIAQAILESGWGKSKIGNNIFGIKAGSSWTGKTINCQTGEQNPDGSRYTINADFRDYDSISDSIEDHAKLLTNDRYKKVIEASDYKEACYAVREAGYATSLDYSKNLINIIETYGLDQWDPK